MGNGVELIRDERLRQACQLGWTPEHDDEHVRGEMAMAAVAYLLFNDQRHCNRSLDYWPWLRSGFHPDSDDGIRNLQKAGALIAAEIDRIQRARND